MTATRRRLGSGPAFPLSPARTRGSLTLRTGAEKVADAIEIILRTEPGERLMRPAYGCGLCQFLMEPNTVATRSRLQRAVTRALEAFEPRIKLRTVSAAAGADDPARVDITIHYEHQRDGSEGVLVFPFYLET